MKKPQWIGVLAFVLAPGLASAEEPDSRAYDSELLQLRTEAAEINAEIVALEEAILYPANTRIAVYLSFEQDALFQVDSIALSVDGRLASAYLYSPQERRALAEGGIHRLYLGNLARGEHSISTTLKGRDSDGREVLKEQSFQFVKDDDTETLQLSVQAQPSAAEPHLALKHWQ